MLLHVLISGPDKPPLLLCLIDWERQDLASKNVFEQAMDPWAQPALNCSWDLIRLLSLPLVESLHAMPPLLLTYILELHLRCNKDAHSFLAETNVLFIFPLLHSPYHLPRLTLSSSNFQCSRYTIITTWLVMRHIELFSVYVRFLRVNPWTEIPCSQIFIYWSSIPWRANPSDKCLVFLAI